MSDLVERLKRFDSEYRRLLCDDDDVCDFQMTKSIVKDSLVEMAVKS